jgi:hypothetical protein
MKIWTAPEFTKRHRGRMGIMGSIATGLAIACAIVGIIAEARGTFFIGLISTSWFLLAIASLIFSLGCWLGWAVGIYLQAREKETKTEGQDQSIPISQT